MASNKIKSKDYRSLTNPGRKSPDSSGDIPSLKKPSKATPPAESELRGSVDAAPPFDRAETSPVVTEFPVPPPHNPTPQSSRKEKKVRKDHKDRELLTSDRWLIRKGHDLTYVALFLFSIMVLFRPYEIVPGMGFLSGTAFYFALATIVLFIPSQLATEGTLTTFPTEVKAILAMVLIALLTMPIARDPAMAWETFNDSFIKAVIIFIVLINVVRTRQRLMGIMWLSFGVGIYLGFSALNLYLQGKFTVEEYRVAVDVGGMFGNPNEMAMHFVMMTPIAFTLGLAARKSLVRWVYFAMAALFVAANMVTFSRGGFLGLIACLLVLAWKVGRKYRLNVAIGSIIFGGLAIIAAPGNYGLRMLSIFIPGLDTVGSSDQRWELLMRSLLVTARNPWGIGIGNFPIVGIRDLQSHNAFTQVSAELGLMGLAAYLVFIISPYRKLSAIERTLFDADDHSWYYYLSIGLQASIVGYLMSSFFASVAYNWFVYYLVAYAVAFRRIYAIETGATEVAKQPAPASEPAPAV